MSMEAERYWLSEEGIGMRLDLLGEEVTWDYFNNAVKVTANSLGITKLQIVGELDEATCPYCQGLYDENGEGRVYLIHWFLPDLPAHLGCRHFWNVIVG